MKREAALLAALLVLVTLALSSAEKLPIDEGLTVTLSPGITKMRVGQTVDFTMSFTDDDAVYESPALTSWATAPSVASSQVSPPRRA